MLSRRDQPAQELGRSKRDWDSIDVILAIDPTMIGHPDVAAARQEIKDANGC